MDSTLYTGNGSTQTITNAGGFKPDFVWAKNRSGTRTHCLFDSVRGAGKVLLSQSTNAETGNSGDLLGSFNSNGFEVNLNYLGGTNDSSNASGQTFVGWQWQAGSSTVTNTSGSISSQVRANTTAGFSIVTYTGTGANATVGHGLGVAPKMIIVKVRSTANDWAVYHSGLTSAVFRLQLNTTIAQASTPTAWNSTAPTSTVFSVGTLTETNASAATYVAYCWAEIAGFSKFGSYTGNGSTDGTFVYTGFRPKFIMIKSSSAVGNWRIFDTSLNPYNLSTQSLAPNLINSENTGTTLVIDILSNGIKMKGNDSNTNGSGVTYIYAAFAENPFKNSNAR
jgi:hypothetical protein